uniref:Cytochrome P450 n=1 Tax=Dendroctonus armandi TaxID=77159 RepID=A0A0M4HF32_9CUCU|nr:cytochrome P450 [Dendroctonus armandi]
MFYAPRGQRFAHWSCRFIRTMPAPKGLPVFGTTLSLMMAGSSPKLHRYIDARHHQLGPIFQESIGPVPCVFVADPADMRLVFAKEGKYPRHLLPEAWTVYNQLHNVSRGLFFMDGVEWLHFRRLLNPVLLKGDQEWLRQSCGPPVERLLAQICAAPDKPPIRQLLYYWSLEVIVSVLIGSEQYCLWRSRLADQIGLLASCVHEVFETSAKMTLIPAGLASKCRLPRWKRFEGAATTALKAATDLVETLESNQGLLGRVQGQMTVNELAKIVADLILAAGDTTAFSMEWLLYLVAKHPEVQSRLKAEPPESAYLRNTVKEGLRLYPVAPFLTRILSEDIRIKGFDIPAGTVLILSIFTSGRDPASFPDPHRFDPERWADGRARRSASLPFAMGARCAPTRIRFGIFENWFLGRASGASWPNISSKPR